MKNTMKIKESELHEMIKASVKKIDVQSYKETDGFLGRNRLEKDGTDTTLRIDFSW